MEESEDQSDNTSDITSTTTGTKKLTPESNGTHVSKSNNSGSDKKQVDRDVHSVTNKCDTENTGSDSDESKDEVSFKPDVLAAAAAKLAEISQSKSEVVGEPHKRQNIDEVLGDDRGDMIKHRNDGMTKYISDELKEGREIRPRVMGAEDEDPLVIDEAEEDETKSESDMAGGSEGLFAGLLGVVHYGTKGSESF